MEEPSARSNRPYLVALAIASALAACAVPPARPIDLDQAVALANDAVKGKLDPKFAPLRVLIATEKDVRSVRRCLHDDFPDAADHVAYVKSVREKIAGRRLYVVRYPLPPIDPDEEGKISYTGVEPCVLIDRDTGEVLGVLSD